MGQKCGVPDIAPACKQGPVGVCICKHADLRALKADIDEQEDLVHQLTENDTSAGWSKNSSISRKAAIRHVENAPVPQGGVYTGQAQQDGQPHGVGTQRWADGTVYSGSWASGAAHGHGKLEKSDGSGYDGFWVEGRKHGVGHERLVDQSEYRGDFADGQKHGRGTFKWKGGANYTGEFCEDVLQGEGVFLWGDGRSFRGQWMQSLMHGQGRFEWPDGKAFEGRYENDKKHGPGTFMWPDGSKCLGMWQAGKQHGIGTHVNAKGVARKGRWKHGELEQWLDPPVQTSESSEAEAPRAAGAVKPGSLHSAASPAASSVAPVAPGGDDRKVINML